MSCKPRDAPEPDADSSTLGAMAELLAAARASGCEALLENFTAAFIAAVSSGCPGESPCARAAAALDKLKKIATAHAECAAMEALMDKAYFRELVVERDYFSYGGLDKQGRNILWYACSATAPRCSDILPLRLCPAADETYRLAPGPHEQGAVGQGAEGDVGAQAQLGPRPCLRPRTHLLLSGALRHGHGEQHLLGGHLL
jgi:hypothetical protein